jgi:hypothetical protein
MGKKLSTFIGDSTYTRAPPTYRSPLRFNYPPSVSISIKRAQNRIENYQMVIKEPTSNEVVNSQPVQSNRRTDIQDLLKTTTNLKDTASICEKLEQQGFDIGKH